MKQIGVILLGICLTLSMSCSKDTSLDIGPSQEMAIFVSPHGIFEGEWQLKKYGMTCPGTIVVDSNQIRFDVPADYLIPRLGLVDETSKAAHPDEPFFTTTSDYSYYNTSQVMQYSTQGYSSDATYLQLRNEGFDNQTEPQANNALSLGVKADDADYRIDLLGIKEQPTAVFDLSAGLWRLAIPIDKVTIYNKKTAMQISIAVLDEDAPDKSAWLFVFRAKKKVK